MKQKVNEGLKDTLKAGVNKVKDGMNKLANRGYMEGKPEKISDVLKGNGWKLYKMIEKAPDHMTFTVVRDNDVPYTRFLQDPDGMSFEELVEDLNTFFFENGKRMHASGDDNLEDNREPYSTGRYIRIEKETINTPVSQNACYATPDDFSVNEDVQKIAQLVANSAKRALNEMRLAHEMDKYDFGRMVDDENFVDDEEIPEDDFGGEAIESPVSQKACYAKPGKIGKPKSEKEKESDEFFDGEGNAINQDGSIDGQGEDEMFNDPMVAETARKIANMLINEITGNLKK